MLGNSRKVLEKCQKSAKKCQKMLDRFRIVSSKCGQLSTQQTRFQSLFWTPDPSSPTNFLNGTIPRKKLNKFGHPPHPPTKFLAESDHSNNKIFFATVLMDPCGPIWTYLDLFERIWTLMDPIWIHMDSFGPLDVFGPS